MSTNFHTNVGSADIAAFLQFQARCILAILLSHGKSLKIVNMKQMKALPNPLQIQTPHHLDPKYLIVPNRSISLTSHRCHQVCQLQDSMHQEIPNEAKHKSKQIITLEQGSLKSSVTHSLDDVDTSTELRLFFAFRRRHLAFEMMHMLSWEACQLWFDKLMGSLLSEAPQHFGALNLTQILRADRDFFRYLQQNTKGISRVNPLKHHRWMRLSVGLCMIHALTCILYHCSKVRRGHWRQTNSIMMLR